MGYDNNFPAWFSSILFVVGAILCIECYQRSKTSAVAVPRAGTLIALAALMILMSCDEIVGFHEHFGGMLANRMGVSSATFAKHTGWVWAAGPLVILLFLVAAACLKRTLSVAKGSTKLLAAGFALIILGGVVLESTINFLNHEELQWLWDLEIIVEESLEMLGSIIIAYAILNLRDTLVGVEVASPS